SPAIVDAEARELRRLREVHPAISQTTGSVANAGAGAVWVQQRRVGILEHHVEIFALHGPVLREGEFHAGTHGQPRFPLVLRGENKGCYRSALKVKGVKSVRVLDVGERDARSDVEQGAIKRQPAAGAECSEFTELEGGRRTEASAQIEEFGLIQAHPVVVAFEADDGGANLVIIARLRADGAKRLLKPGVSVEAIVG